MTTKLLVLLLFFLSATFSCKNEQKETAKTTPEATVKKHKGQTAIKDSNSAPIALDVAKSLVV